MGTVTAALNLFAGAITVIALLSYAGTEKTVPRHYRTFRRVMTVTAVMLLTDGVALLFLRQYRFPFIALETVSTVSFYAGLAMYTRYVSSLLHSPQDVFAKILQSVVYGFCGLGALFWLVNAFYPFIYDYDEQAYVSDFFHLLLTGIGFGILLATFVFLLINRKALSLDDFLSLSALPVAPLCSLAAEALVPGLSLHYVMIFIVLLANYTHNVRKESLALQEQIRNTERYRLKSTMERIKPHYIYNVLTSIYYLCDMDASLAQEAIGIFSDYLRDVLDNMEAQALIPFSKELRTVRNYLELEQMRFGDMIAVEYEIGTDDFSIPPFTVQPLVENAVKHGVAKRGLTATIRLISGETPEGYYVAVQDNCGGFVPDGSPEGDGRTGIRYIRQVLEEAVNGRLLIESTPGEGTTVTVLIPKKRD